MGEMQIIENLGVSTEGFRVCLAGIENTIFILFSGNLKLQVLGKCQTGWSVEVSGEP